jgi:hypothetical protein
VTNKNEEDFKIVASTADVDAGLPALPEKERELTFGPRNPDMKCHSEDFKTYGGNVGSNVANEIISKGMEEISKGGTDKFDRVWYLFL